MVETAPAPQRPQPQPVAAVEPVEAIEPAAPVTVPADARRVIIRSGSVHTVSIELWTANNTLGDSLARALPACIDLPPGTAELHLRTTDGDGAYRFHWQGQGAYSDEECDRLRR